MRQKFPAIALSTLCMLPLAAAWAGTEGATNTTYGLGAGAALTTGTGNTLHGASAGANITNGERNTLVGYSAGINMTNANGNTSIGDFTGANQTGSYNVFLGYLAGSVPSSQSNRLYIDNCYYLTVFCEFPFIYGEFDNRVLVLDGVLNVSNKSTGLAKSQLHFSLAETDAGGWLTSVGDNNFFMSSGARFEGAAGGWIQRSADGNAVMAGSGGTGYRVFTSTGTAVGAVPNSLLTRLHIDYGGLIGLNTTTVAGRAIATGTGAYLSTGGVWTNASSRDLKENIRELSAKDALQTLEGLHPVSFQYKNTDGEAHVGFIAEDVPQLVATKDRKSLSSMDVVAVLTKVVKEQDREMAQMRQQLSQLAAEVRRMRAAAN
jgi:hypothetical protein